LIIIPSLQTKLSGFDGNEFTYPYTFTVSITGAVPTGEDPVVIQKLLDQIAALKKQIADILASSPAQIPGGVLCASFTDNLYFGMVSSRVSCLQKFLVLQGPEIYPEAFVTGNFGSLTRAAVVRLQEKYRNDILLPAGLFYGTGFVGPLTRQKINSLIAS